MKNIAFVVWMLLFPFLDKLGNYLLFLRGIKPYEFTYGAFCLWILFYLFIACLLYEKHE
ncbi:MAG: hypothetical protein WC878_02395 [Candidatus Paceibacterota bacterium]|jgi:hypothetical protein